MEGSDVLCIKPEEMTDGYGQFFKSAIGICILVLMVIGCERGSEYKKVDFSKKKVAVSQPAPKGSATGSNRLRFAVAALISPKETIKFYNELLTYIGDQVDREIELLQRKTYVEVNELFPQRKIDMAFVCTGPYATQRDIYEFEAVATPVVRGKPYYQSYLIVHHDSNIQNLSALRQQTFAFTDPDSNTGALVPTYWLYKMDETPATFFKSTVYTYSHDNSIMAVAKGLVAGATVDSQIWEYFQESASFYTSQTRIIRKSAPFGSPPLVVSAHMADDLKDQIRGVVLNMGNNKTGRAILKKLMIDGFVAPDDNWYRPVQDMSAALHAGKG